MEIKFPGWVKDMELDINWSMLSADEVDAVKKVLNVTNAEFVFHTRWRLVSHKGRTLFGYTLPLLTSKQYEILKRV